MLFTQRNYCNALSTPLERRWKYSWRHFLALLIAPTTNKQQRSSLVPDPRSLRSSPSPSHVYNFFHCPHHLFFFNKKHHICSTKTRSPGAQDCVPPSASSWTASEASPWKGKVFEKTQKSRTMRLRVVWKGKLISSQRTLPFWCVTENLRAQKRNICRKRKAWLSKESSNFCLQLLLQSW